MERRKFIQLSLASAGLGLVTPTLAQAKAAQPVPGPSDIYYTKVSLGRWVGKEATHLPVVEITKAAGGTTVKIVTPHEMKAYEHYIVKHVLLDKHYKFIDEHLFEPTQDKTAESTFTLKGYSGAIYALSLCNKHDLWLASAQV
ncbi:MAG: hypothetical protein HOO93_04165 [Methyloglobulus sp.]|nr:hypothetical protein [Methyloglobulus sp.]NOU20976.1 hypothetical protein [Methyloglobulus sp.]